MQTSAVTLPQPAPSSARLPGCSHRRLRSHRGSGLRQHAQAPSKASELTSQIVTLRDAQFELVSTKATSTHTPVLFLHGAGHGAWCWAEYFMPWLAEQGLECHALSFRGHGKSPIPQGVEKSAGTLESHAEDIAALVATMRAPPVTVGHSFGGLILQRYLADAADGKAGFAELPGAVFVASGGPKGADMLRFVTRAPIASFKAIRALVTKNYETDLKSLRNAFFHEGTPEEELQRLQPMFAAQATPLTLVDLKTMRSQELPVPSVPDDHVPPTLVLGAREDKIVDSQDCAHVAACFNTEAKQIDGSGHDLMLDSAWREFASEIADFVKAL